MGNIYPSGFSDWLALLTAVTPFVLTAVSAISNTINNRLKRREEEWKRLQELAAIIYNKDGGSGAFAQLLAARELKRFRKLRKEARSIADGMVDFFSNIPQESAEENRLVKVLREIR